MTVSPPEPQSPASGNATVESYAGYEEWKGWTNFFTFDRDDAEYFAGELKELPPLKGKTVLEIGFGTGSFLAWARAQGAIVFGTELNERLVAEATRADIGLLDPAVENIAVENRERYDLIAAFDVFEHFDLEEIHARIRAVETMLKPGGYAILRFPNGQSPFGFIPQHGDITHKTALSLSRMEQVLLGTGLTPVRYRCSYRIRGPLGMRRAVRAVRAVMQKIVGRTLDFIYATRMPWESVVVLVLQKGKPG